MMSYNQRTLGSVIGILLVLFMASASFAQQPDAGLTQSQFMQIIDRIDKVEENMRDYVDTKFGELDKRIDELDKKFGEKFEKLSTDVAYINGQLNSIKWGLTIFVAPLLVSIVAGMVVIIVQNNISGKREAKVASEVAAEVAAKVATEILTQNRVELDEDV